MKWSLIVAGEPPSDLDAIAAAAGSDRPAAPRTAEAVAGLVSEAATEGLVVVGTDADLATVVGIMLSAGGDLPVALVSRDASDLLPMFGLERAKVVARLQTGGRYRSDLGRVTIDGTQRPFVTHVTAASQRGLGALSPSADVAIVTDRSSHHGRGWWVAACNAQHVAGRTIAPKAALTDGKIDIQMFGGSALARTRLRRLSRHGLHLTHPALWRRSVTSCAVVAPAHWGIKVDGIPAGSGAWEVAVDADAFDLWI
jgi:hypothetical protein